MCHVIDEFTRQHLAVRVERCMASMIDMRDLAVLARGAPQVRAGGSWAIPTFLTPGPALWAGS